MPINERKLVLHKIQAVFQIMYPHYEIYQRLGGEEKNIVKGQHISVHYIPLDLGETTLFIELCFKIRYLFEQCFGCRSSIKKPGFKQTRQVERFRLNFQTVYKK